MTTSGLSSCTITTLGGIRLESIKRRGTFPRRIFLLYLQVLAEFVLLLQEATAPKIVGQRFDHALHTQHRAGLQKQFVLHIPHVAHQ